MSRAKIELYQMRQKAANVKRKFLKLILVLFLSAIWGCNENIDIENWKISETKFNELTSETGDSIFFKGMNSINISDSIVIITDSPSARFFVTNMQFANPRFIGKKGKGPGELLYPTYGLYKNDLIYILDPAIKGINIYKANGEFKIKIPAYVNSFENFILANKNMVLPARNEKFQFIVLNVMGDTVHYFGNKLEFNDQRKNKMYNVPILANDESDNIYTTSFTYPILQKYENYKLVWQKDLTEINEIDEAFLKKQEIVRDNSVSFVSLCKSLKYNKGALYLLISNKDYGLSIFKFNSLDGSFIAKINIETANDDQLIKDIDVTGDSIYFIDEGNQVCGIAVRSTD